MSAMDLLTRRGGRPSKRAATDPHDLAASLRQIAEVCDRLADGDLEARIEDVAQTPEAQAAQASINRLLDITDAFVRESSASLSSAAEGRFYRRFLVRGMPGAYRHGAARINDAGSAMRQASEKLAEAEADRQRLADDLESTVLQASEQMAAASTELQATAADLTAFAHRAVSEVSEAGQIMASLQATSEEIGEAVRLITQVATQTRLLALNASMEAAKAGAAGRGFAVVAEEVRLLADRASEATGTIAQRVGAVQSAGGRAIEAIDGVSQRIAGLESVAGGIAMAVDGCQAEGAGVAGLSPLAELLRVEVVRLLAVVRGA